MRPFSIFLLLSLACGPLLAATDVDLVELKPAQLQRLDIRSLTLAAGGGMAHRGLPAQVVVPNAQMRVVSAPLAGVVESLLVAPGMAVRKGQPLARLASPQALELQRDIHQTGAQAELTRQNWQRDELLFKEGLIAQSRLQASRVAALNADAAASERRQALGLAGAVRGASLTLVSPLDGVVLEQTANLGQRVDAQMPLYRIGQLSPLWLEIQVPAELAALVREGLSVEAGGARGKIIAVGRAVNPGSQTVLLRALMKEGVESLRPGQSVEARIDLPAAAGFSLPAAALARNAGRTVVFVQQGAGNAFRAVNVTLLSQGSDSVQVDGVKAGDRVAVQGVSGLKAVWTGVGRE